MHDEHCPRCRQVILAMLRRQFGDCRTGELFDWPVRLGDHKGTKVFGTLARVHEALGSLRGHATFIKAPRLPACDFFLPDIPLIVEYDESAHFTPARAAALACYPADLEVGFPVAEWRTRCEQLRKEDVQPAYKDEERAWHDTLRDLLPRRFDFRPTARIYAKATVWCRLDPGDAKDLATFLKLSSLATVRPAPRPKWDERDEV